MKKKDLLYIALGLTVGAGVYYMGKAKIMKNIIQEGQAKYDDKGKVVLTEKGSSNSSSVNKNSTSVSPFDYNNSSLHSSKNYWLNNSSGTFYLDVYKDGKKTGEIVEFTVDNGNVEPTFKESVKQGLESLIFWK